MYIYIYTYIRCDFQFRHLRPGLYFHQNQAIAHDPSIARVLRLICITADSTTYLEKTVLCSGFLPGQGCWLDMEGEKRPMASNKAHRSLAKFLVANIHVMWFVVSGLDFDQINLRPAGNLNII